MRLIGAAISAVVGLVAASCSSPTENPSTTTTAQPATSSATASQPGESTLTPVVGSVLAAPIPLPATDGKIHLAYELLLTNASGQEVQLTSVAAVADGKTLLRLSGDGLAYWTRVLGTDDPTTTLGIGVTATVWLNVAVDEPADSPATIEHVIGVSLAQPELPVLPATVTATMAPTPVQGPRKPVVISPPLDGPNWVNVNGCCGMTSHREAEGPINGQLLIGERFAIDYVQPTPNRRSFDGDKTNVESYAYFGADVHAVADGPVVAAVDGLPEQIPGVKPTGMLLAERGGNHIIQDIGDGNYVFYAHLKPGSVTAKVGDRLKAGQTLGQLGNSGNTYGPHLHLEVMNNADQLRANGLPFVFSSFRLDSRVPSELALNTFFDTGGPVRIQPGFAAQDETDVMPLYLDVMTYGQPTRDFRVWPGAGRQPA